MAESTRLPFEVYIEDNAESITLQLTAAEAARANTDNAFLLRLIDQEKGKRKKILVSQIKTNKKINIYMPAEEGLSPALSPSASKTDAPCTSSPAHSVQCTLTQNVNESTDNEKSLFIWSSKNVYLLLEKYEERMNEFSSGTKRNSKIWESIAYDMNEIDPEIAVLGTQCQSKMNSMKKMFRKIIDYNNVSGNDRKSWQYFERMYELFGKSGWTSPKATASEAGPLPSTNSADENMKEAPATRKPKLEKVLNEFMEKVKEDKQEREKRKEERKVIILQELKEQKEKHHHEKMDIMRTFCETIAGKKLFD